MIKNPPRSPFYPKGHARKGGSKVLHWIPAFAGMTARFEIATEHEVLLAMTKMKVDLP